MPSVLKIRRNGKSRIPLSRETRRNERQWIYVANMCLDQNGESYVRDTILKASLYVSTKLPALILLKFKRNKKERL